MSGKLQSSRNVTIGVNGEFDGEIQAKKVVVSGCIEGSIDAERLEIVSTGKVRGEIRVAELVIEPGGQFNGSSEITISDNSEPRRISHQPNGKTDKTPGQADAESSERFDATGS